MDSEADRVESGLLQFDSKPRPRPEIQYIVDDVAGGVVDSPLMKRNSLGRHAALPVTSVGYLFFHLPVFIFRFPFFVV